MKRHPPTSFLRRARLRSACRGFTILEVALATAVMAMGIGTSIPVMQRGFRMIDSARNLTTAGQIMTSQLEQVRMLDWATVAAYPTAATPVSLDSVFSGNSSVGSRFTLTRTVSTQSTNVLEVTFTMTWSGMDGRQTSRTMTTYYARYGMHDYIYNGS